MGKNQDKRLTGEDKELGLLLRELEKLGVKLEGAEMNLSFKENYAGQMERKLVIKFSDGSMMEAFSSQVGRVAAHKFQLLNNAERELSRSNEALEKGKSPDAGVNRYEIQAAQANKLRLELLTEALYEGKSIDSREIRAAEMKYLVYEARVEANSRLESLERRSKSDGLLSLSGSAEKTFYEKFIEFTERGETGWSETRQLRDLAGYVLDRQMKSEFDAIEGLYKGASKYERNQISRFKRDRAAQVKELRGGKLHELVSNVNQKSFFVERVESGMAFAIKIREAVGKAGATEIDRLAESVLNDLFSEAYLSGDRSGITNSMRRLFDALEPLRNKLEKTLTEPIDGKETVADRLAGLDPKIESSARESARIRDEVSKKVFGVEEARLGIMEKLALDMSIATEMLKRAGVTPDLGKSINQMEMIFNNLLGRINALETAGGKTFAFMLSTSLGFHLFPEGSGVAEYLAAKKTDGQQLLSGQTLKLANALGIELYSGTNLYENGQYESIATLYKGEPQVGARGRLIVFDLQSRGFLELNARMDKGNVALHEALDNVKFRMVDEADVAALSREAFVLGTGNSYAPKEFVDHIERLINELGIGESTVIEKGRQVEGENAFRMRDGSVEYSSRLEARINEVANRIAGKSDYSVAEIKAQIDNIYRAKFNLWESSAGKESISFVDGQPTSVQSGTQRSNTTDQSASYNVAAVILRISEVGGEMLGLNKYRVKLSESMGESTLSQIFSRVRHSSAGEAIATITSGGSATIDIAKEIAHAIYGSTAVEVQGSKLRSVSERTFESQRGQQHHLNVEFAEGRAAIIEVAVKRAKEFLLGDVKEATYRSAETGKMVTDRIGEVFGAKDASYLKDILVGSLRELGVESIRANLKGQALENGLRQFNEMFDSVIRETNGRSLTELKTRLAEVFAEGSIANLSTYLDKIQIIDARLAEISPDTATQFARNAKGKLTLTNESGLRGMDFQSIDIRILDGHNFSEGELLQAIGRAGRNRNDYTDYKQIVYMDVASLRMTLERAAAINDFMSSETGRGIFDNSPSIEAALNAIRENGYAFSTQDAYMAKIQILEVSSRFRSLQMKSESILFKAMVEASYILVKEPVSILMTKARRAGNELDAQFLERSYLKIIEHTESSLRRGAEGNELRDPADILKNTFEGIINTARTELTKVAEGLSDPGLRSEMRLRLLDIERNGTTHSFDQLVESYRMGASGFDSATFAGASRRVALDTSPVLDVAKVLVRLSDFVLPSEGNDAARRPIKLLDATSEVGRQTGDRSASKLAGTEYIQNRVNHSDQTISHSTYQRLVGALPSFYRFLSVDSSGLERLMSSLGDDINAQYLMRVKVYTQNGLSANMAVALAVVSVLSDNGVDMNAANTGTVILLTQALRAGASLSISDLRLAIKRQVTLARLDPKNENAATLQRMSPTIQLLRGVGSMGALQPLITGFDKMMRLQQNVVDSHLAQSTSNGVVGKVLSLAGIIISRAQFRFGMWVFNRSINPTLNNSGIDDASMPLVMAAFNPELSDYSLRARFMEGVTGIRSNSNLSQRQKDQIFSRATLADWVAYAKSPDLGATGKFVADHTGWRPLAWVPAPVKRLALPVVAGVAAPLILLAGGAAAVLPVFSALGTAYMLVMVVTSVYTVFANRGKDTEKPAGRFGAMKGMGGPMGLLGAVVGVKAIADALMAGVSLPAALGGSAIIPALGAAVLGPVAIVAGLIAFGFVVGGALYQAQKPVGAGINSLAHRGDLSRYDAARLAKAALEARTDADWQELFAAHQANVKDKLAQLTEEEKQLSSQLDMFRQRGMDKHPQIKSRIERLEKQLGELRKQKEDLSGDLKVFKAAAMKDPRLAKLTPRDIRRLAIRRAGVQLPGSITAIEADMEDLLYAEDINVSLEREVRKVLRAEQELKFWLFGATGSADRDGYDAVIAAAVEMGGKLGDKILGMTVDDLRHVRLADKGDFLAKVELGLLVEELKKETDGRKAADVAPIPDTVAARQKEYTHLTAADVHRAYLLARGGNQAEAVDALEKLITENRQTQLLYADSVESAERDLPLEVLLLMIAREKQLSLEAAYLLARAMDINATRFGAWVSRYADQVDEMASIEELRKAELGPEVVMSVLEAEALASREEIIARLEGSQKRAITSDLLGERSTEVVRKLEELEAEFQEDIAFVEVVDALYKDQAGQLTGRPDFSLDPDTGRLDGMTVRRYENGKGVTVSLMRMKEDGWVRVQDGNQVKLVLEAQPNKPVAVWDVQAGESPSIIVTKEFDVRTGTEMTAFTVKGEKIVVTMAEGKIVDVSSASKEGDQFSRLIETVRNAYENGEGMNAADLKAATDRAQNATKDLLDSFQIRTQNVYQYIIGRAVSAETIEQNRAALIDRFGKDFVDALDPILLAGDIGPLLSISSDRFMRLPPRVRAKLLNEAVRELVAAEIKADPKSPVKLNKAIEQAAGRAQNADAAKQAGERLRNARISGLSEEDTDTLAKALVAFLEFGNDPGRAVSLAKRLLKANEGQRKAVLAELAEWGISLNFTSLGRFRKQSALAGQLRDQWLVQDHKSRIQGRDIDLFNYENAMDRKDLRPVEAAVYTGFALVQLFRHLPATVEGEAAMLMRVGGVLAKADAQNRAVIIGILKDHGFTFAVPKVKGGRNMALAVAKVVHGNLDNPAKVPTISYRHEMSKPGITDIQKTLATAYALVSAINDEVSLPEADLPLLVRTIARSDSAQKAVIAQVLAENGIQGLDLESLPRHRVLALPFRNRQTLDDVSGKINAQRLSSARARYEQFLDARFPADEYAARDEAIKQFEAQIARDPAVLRNMARNDEALKALPLRRVLAIIALNHYVGVSANPAASEEALAAAEAALFENCAALPEAERAALLRELAASVEFELSDEVELGLPSVDEKTFTSALHRDRQQYLKEQADAEAARLGEAMDKVLDVLKEAGAYTEDTFRFTAKGGYKEGQTVRGVATQRLTGDADQAVNAALDRISQEDADVKALLANEANAQLELLQRAFYWAPVPDSVAEDAAQSAKRSVSAKARSPRSTGWLIPVFFTFDGALRRGGEILSDIAYRLRITLPGVTLIVLTGMTIVFAVKAAPVLIVLAPSLLPLAPALISIAFLGGLVVMLLSNPAARQMTSRQRAVGPILEPTESVVEGETQAPVETPVRTKTVKSPKAVVPVATEAVNVAPTVKVTPETPLDQVDNTKRMKKVRAAVAPYVQSTTSLLAVTSKQHHDLVTAFLGGRLVYRSWAVEELRKSGIILDLAEVERLIKAGKARELEDYISQAYEKAIGDISSIVGRVLKRIDQPRFANGVLLTEKDGPLSYEVTSIAKSQGVPEAVPAALRLAETIIAYLRPMKTLPANVSDPRGALELAQVLVELSAGERVAILRALAQMGVQVTEEDIKAANESAVVLAERLVAARDRALEAERQTIVLLLAESVDRSLFDLKDWMRMNKDKTVGEILTREAAAEVTNKIWLGLKFSDVYAWTTVDDTGREVSVLETVFNAWARPIVEQTSYAKGELQGAATRVSLMGILLNRVRDGSLTDARSALLGEIAVNEKRFPADRAAALIVLSLLGVNVSSLVSRFDPQIEETLGLLRAFQAPLQALDDSPSFESAQALAAHLSTLPRTRRDLVLAALAVQRVTVTEANRNVDSLAAQLAAARERAIQQGRHEVLAAMVKADGWVALALRVLKSSIGLENQLVSDVLSAAELAKLPEEWRNAPLSLFDTQVLTALASAGWRDAMLSPQTLSTVKIMAGKLARSSDKKAALEFYQTMQDENLASLATDVQQQKGAGFLEDLRGENAALIAGDIRSEDARAFAGDVAEEGRVESADELKSGPVQNLTISQIPASAPTEVGGPSSPALAAGNLNPEVVKLIVRYLIATKQAAVVWGKGAARPGEMKVEKGAAQEVDGLKKLMVYADQLLDPETREFMRSTHIIALQDAPHAPTAVRAFEIMQLVEKGDWVALESVMIAPESWAALEMLVMTLAGQSNPSNYRLFDPAPTGNGAREQLQGILQFLVDQYAEGVVLSDRQMQVFEHLFHALMTPAEAASFAVRLFAAAQSGNPLVFRHSQFSFSADMDEGKVNGIYNQVFERLLERARARKARMDRGERLSTPKISGTGETMYLYLHEQEGGIQVVEPGIAARRLFAPQGLVREMINTGNFLALAQLIAHEVKGHFLNRDQDPNRQESLAREAEQEVKTRFDQLTSTEGHALHEFKGKAFKTLSNMVPELGEYRRQAAIWHMEWIVAPGDSTTQAASRKESVAAAGVFGFFGVVGVFGVAALVVSQAAVISVAGTAIGAAFSLIAAGLYTIFSADLARAGVDTAATTTVDRFGLSGMRGIPKGDLRYRISFREDMTKEQYDQLSRPSKAMLAAQEYVHIVTGMARNSVLPKFMRNWKVVGFFDEALAHTLAVSLMVPFMFMTAGTDLYRQQNLRNRNYSPSALMASVDELGPESFSAEQVGRPESIRILNLGYADPHSTILKANISSPKGQVIESEHEVPAQVTNDLVAKHGIDAAATPKTVRVKASLFKDGALPLHTHILEPGESAEDLKPSLQDVMTAIYTTPHMSGLTTAVVGGKRHFTYYRVVDKGNDATVEMYTWAQGEQHPVTPQASPKLSTMILEAIPYADRKVEIAGVTMPAGALLVLSSLNVGSISQFLRRIGKDARSFADACEAAYKDPRVLGQSRTGLLTAQGLRQFTSTYLSAVYGGINAAVVSQMTGVNPSISSAGVSSYTPESLQQLVDNALSGLGMPQENAASTDNLDQNKVQNADMGALIVDVDKGADLKTVAQSINSFFRAVGNTDKGDKVRVVILGDRLSIKQQVELLGSLRSNRDRIVVVDTRQANLFDRNPVNPDDVLVNLGKLIAALPQLFRMDPKLTFGAEVATSAAGNPDLRFTNYKNLGIVIRGMDLLKDIGKTIENMFRAVVVASQSA